MNPPDWRTPRFLYAVEVLRRKEGWVQLDGITPFRDVAERGAAATLTLPCRLVIYERAASQPKHKGQCSDQCPGALQCSCPCHAAAQEEEE